MLKNIYASQQNVISDLHRLHLLRCYFGALFSGHNRFIWGMGFTNASNFLCKDVDLIKGTTHAHNVFAQVAADSGFFAMLALVLIFAWFLLRTWKRLRWCGDPLILASCCLFLYLLLFMQIEGGWGKVTFLQTLTGLSLGALTMVRPAGPALRAESGDDEGS